MKFLTVFALALSASAFAGHHEMMKDMDKRPFAENKKMMSEMLEKKTTMVDEAKNCVNSAKDNAALKACHEKMMMHKQSMEEKMEGKMDDMKKKM
jgi:hypothetical protein